jgi:long-chain acyl-CoA synthetase
MTAGTTLSIASTLADSATRYPERPAVVIGDRTLTYAELWQQALQYAGALRAHGIGVGDRVALLLPNTEHFPLSYYGALALGAVAVPVHALLKAEEIAFVLSDAGAALLVCATALQGEGAKGAELAGVRLVAPEDLATGAAIDALVPRQPLDTAVVLYTSGTTGKPKGAEISHLNAVMNCNVAAMNCFDIGPGDIVLGCLPLFHTFGQTCTMNTGFRAGATVVLLPRFDGAEALRLLVDEACTLFMGVPSMYVALLAAARTSERRPALKMAISGGAALPEVLLEEFQEVFGCAVFEGYGLTETAPIASFNQKGAVPRPGTVGTAVWGVDVEVARAELEGAIELLPRGELGELVIRGHNVFTGYLNDPGATAAAIVDGWFRTGDLGTKDADGYLRIVDRKKDMVLRNGYNVYPRDVEEVVLRHDAVGQVAVIGIPDAVVGEEVAAVVVLAEGAALSETELVDWAKERLASYKYPRRVFFADALPLGPSGKVLKRELVATYGS